MDPLSLLPEISLLAGALGTLMGGSFLPRRRQWVVRLVAIGAVLVSAALAVSDVAEPATTIYLGSYTVDVPTAAARLIVALATLVVILLGVDELSGDPRESETYALLLLSALGAVVLAGASDLLLLAVGYLLASIPLYGLIGLGRTALAAEAAMKTYLLGALLGIGLLLGVTVLAGIAGATVYADLTVGLTTAPPGAVAFGTVAVLGGLLFKAGGVPGHFWVPDAAQASGAVAASFLTTVPKVGALVAAYRLVSTLPDSVDWSILIAVLAVASMTLGNLAAFAQTDPRRLLGWSTVSQVGYLLLPVAVAGRSELAQPALLLYLAAYAVTNLAAFAAVAALPGRRELAAYRGLAWSRPWLAGALLVSLLGLLGTPPTSVFVGKLAVAAAAWDGGSAWLAAALIVNTVLSLFYYLRWIVPTFRAGEPVERAATGAAMPQPWAAGTAVCAAVASVLLGLTAGGSWAVLA